MQKSIKKLLGIGGLSLVTAMTGVAIAIPAPGAHAEGGAAAGGSAQIVVRVHSGSAELKIEKPSDGIVTTGSTIPVDAYYDDIRSLGYTVEWGENSTILAGYAPENQGGSGNHTFDLDLRAFGGYNNYTLKADLESMNSEHLTDESSFRYSPVTVTYVGTNEAGDPVFEVVYDENTTYVDLDLLGTDGKSVLENPVRTNIEKPGTAGKMTVTIPASTYNLPKGDYGVTATAYGPTAQAEADSDSAIVIYHLTGNTFRINVDYSDFETGGTVYVDGVLVDPSDYDSASGSTLVTLHDDYIQTLSAGTHTLTAAFSTGISASTKFTLVASGSGVAVANGATITADYAYDDNTAEIYFQVIDANGKIIAVPSSRTAVANPGTSGTGNVTLDLSSLDLSNYDLSSITVVALAYPIVGSTKNIAVLDQSGAGVLVAKFAYERPVAPNVPDTGIFGSAINLARVDYLTAGIVGFSAVTIMALRFLHKQNRTSRRRR